ncbi:hypothetical protein Afil01_48080 [Actinorhabdospora filicis]|uniref:Fluoride-specific ion channel FluC n=1 Tax=Actinorhabdospora filicis TaxID=1785913 RepID=A0A9W6WBW8_9ACTN|nr:CrcB family protein [Actinorhabdospora filicis]GLZ80001.1 hypothetical protein Afil01_48080 [Actinorhabdospora filicis]
MSESVDPDVGPGPLSMRLLGVIALGGALGALARWGLVLLWPAPWAVLLINTLGCGLIGVLLARPLSRPLTRPFLGTGVLGGFTTFSAYAVEGVGLLSGSLLNGFLYLGGTLVAALAATWLGLRLGRVVRR